MYVFLLLIVTSIICLVFIYPMKVSFLFDSSEMIIIVSTSWTHLLKAKIDIDMVNYRVRLLIVLFKKTILNKLTDKRKNIDSLSLRALSFNDTHIRAFYGLAQPHFTGFLHGALCFINSLTEIVSVELIPNFIPVTEYLRIEAYTKFNIGKTILNFVKLKYKQLKREKYNGSVKFS